MEGIIENGIWFWWLVAFVLGMICFMIQANERNASRLVIVCRYLAFFSFGINFLMALVGVICSGDVLIPFLISLFPGAYLWVMYCGILRERDPSN